MKKKFEKNAMVYSVFWYTLLFKITRWLDGLFAKLLENRTSGKLYEILSKQQRYLNREGIFYTRSLIYKLLMFVLCYVCKPIVLVCLLFNLVKLLCLPKKSYHKLTGKYIVNALIGIPLIILSIIIPGAKGIFMSVVAFFYCIYMCDEREFEDKYLYTNK